MENETPAFAPAPGVPAATAVPLGVPTNDGHGVLPVLALVIDPEVDRAELDAFLARFRFARRHQVARAADSQAR